MRDSAFRCRNPRHVFSLESIIHRGYSHIRQRWLSGVKPIYYGVKYLKAGYFYESTIHLAVVVSPGDSDVHLRFDTL